MNERDIHQVVKRIRTVIYHVGTLEGSFPRVLKNAPVYTRSHLIVFYEILPDLIRLLEFSSETIPVVGKILGLATEGKSDLEKASEYLGTINKSSETAVTEIFAALDQVGATLQKAQKAESVDDEQKKTLREANMQLMGIMNALQFQDITSQKIEATTALLANLGDGLVGLVRELGVQVESHNISVRQGTYDPEAAFDRDTAGEKQGEIDDLIAGEVAQVKKPAATPNVPSVKEVQMNDEIASDDAGGAVADVDDIDALVASASGGAGGDAIADMDDIDALVASASGDADEEEDQSNDQSDIDALVASAQNGTSESQEVEESLDSDEPFNQDDIDSLLDQ